MNHIMTLGITKAFDKVDRHLLKKIINQKPNTNKAILMNILNLYEFINLQIDDTIIQPSTGMPQGSVFGPVLFLLYINQVLEKVQTALPNINIQAFVDDIIILARTKEELQKALDKTHQEIKNLNLALNLKKCEYISTTKDPIIDPHTSKQIYPVETAKYLGQVIDSKGNPTNIISTYDFGTIKSLIKTAAYQVTRRAKIHIFKTYIKSKFTHLLPLISISGNLLTTWKNIRKTILGDVIEYSTMPREAATLIGLSYYSIIINPY